MTDVVFNAGNCIKPTTPLSGWAVRTACSPEVEGGAESAASQVEVGGTIVVKSRCRWIQILIP